MNVFIFRIVLLIFALLLLPASGALASSSKESKRVLVLYSQDMGHPAHEMTNQGIHAAFQSSARFDVQVYTEYLDAGRFFNPGHDSVVSDYLRRKYADSKIDAIIAVYPYAVDFLLAQKHALFTGVPIIACEMAGRDYAENLERSPARRFVTGTIMGDNITGIMDAVFRMRPETKHIALVAGTTPNDIFSEQAIRMGLKPYAGRIDLIDLTKLSMEETLSRVESLSPDTIVFYSSIFKDGVGKTFVPRDALSSIARVATVPVFGLYESYLGFGIVGGWLVSFEKHGKEAAALALRVMGGESPASIPFGGEHAYVSAYDWRELKRWNIPQTAVQAGAEIRYRIPSFWEAHRQTAMGVISLIIVETSLIVGLFFNIRRRRKLERSLRESEDRVRLAASSAGAGLWSVDLSTRGIWATERARQLFGCALEEPLSYEMMLGHIHPADRDQVRLSLEQAVESGEEMMLKYRVPLPEGNVRWVAYRGRLQQDSPQGPKRLMGTCIDITARKLAEETLRQRENELVTLTGRLIHTQEQELRRLSRDLHDDLTQRLAVLAIDAGMLEKTLRPLQPQASQELADLKIKLIEVSDEVHALSRQLHPRILEDLGLVEAIQSECDVFSRRTGIVVSFDPGDLSVSIPNEIALCLYRVFQEGLQNISKHAEASEARVVLHDLPEGIHLLIQDSGIGFHVEQVAGKGAIGLSSMKERVRLVNGTVSIVSEPGTGTEIHVFIPFGGTHVHGAHPDR